MSAAEKLSLHALAMLTAGVVLASAAFLLWFPQAAEPVLHFREVFGGTFRSVIQTSKQPQVLKGSCCF